MSKITTTIYIECTQTYTIPSVRTGIQRVVRNLVAHIPNLNKEGYDVVPVAFKGSTFYTVPTLQLQSDAQIYRSKKTLIWKFLKLLLFFVKRGANNSATKKFIKNILGDRFSNLLRDFLRGFKEIWFGKSIGAFPLGEVVIFERGDILVLLDSSWENVSKAVETVPPYVVKIGTMYDLVPVLYPELCDDYLAKVFNRWFAFAVNQYGGFICISETVKLELDEYLKRIGSREVKTDFFYLGSNLDINNTEVSDDVSIHPEFNRDDKNFIVVGTLEPRKNVEFILDAFELFMQKNPARSCKLWFIGKRGWKVDSFFKKLKASKFYGSHIFHLTEVSDSELNFLYRNASALIQASKAEGFGLPIVEALQSGLPVLASDIPVFKELCLNTNSVKYFNLNSLLSLAEVMEGDLPPRPDFYHWPTWKAAADSFFCKIIDLAHLVSSSKSDLFGESEVIGE